jgi:protein-disulfide isomerase
MDTKKLLLIFIPALIFIMFGFAFRVYQYAPARPAKKTAEEAKKPDLVPLLPEDPISGDKKAPITIIAFEDLACSSCRNQSVLFQQLLDQNQGKIKIIWKLFPVITFPYDSKLAHTYAFCAHEQNKFYAFKDAAFANAETLSQTMLTTIATNINLNEKKLATCLASGRPELYQQKTQAIGKLLNIQAVPAVFVNNKQIQNAQTLEQWKALLAL